MELTIKIDKKGQMPGSLGWFSDLIENSTFEITETKDGKPCVTLIEKIGENDTRSIILLVLSHKDDAELEEVYDYTNDGMHEGIYRKNVYGRECSLVFQHQLPFSCVFSDAAYNKYIELCDKLEEQLINEFEAE